MSLIAWSVQEKTKVTRHSFVLCNDEENIIVDGNFYFKTVRYTGKERPGRHYELPQNKEIFTNCCKRERAWERWTNARNEEGSF